MDTLLRIVAMLGGLTLIGIAWFTQVAGWSLVDALYMTIITLSTVGYTEVHPLSSADKLFLSGFLVAGLGIFMFGIVQVGELVVRAELGDWWRRRNMDGTINAMQNHFIVCGAGRMGRLLCEDLQSRKVPFVVVDSNAKIMELCTERNWPVIHADATDDDALQQAGIDRAKGVAVTLSTDADNLYVVISARLLNSRVQIVARAHDDASSKKLERAGANRIVSPYESGAAKMCQLLTNPRLNDFFEIISDRDLAFDLVGIPVAEASPIA